MAVEQRSGGLMHALWMFAQPPRWKAMPPTARAVPYVERKGRGVSPLCDIYRPAGEVADSAPSVLLIHGGGFLIGNRAMKATRLVATRLAQAGIGVCSIDYRLIFRGGRLEEALCDVDAAASYWRKNSQSYGCSPSKISLIGLSAGASLMLLHAANTGESYTSLVNVYGPTDFSSVQGRRIEFLMRLLLGSADRQVWRARSPMYSNTIKAPVLTLHGHADRLVPVAHATRFHQARCASGMPSELALFDGAQHGWLNDAALPASDESLLRIVQFLKIQSGV